MNVGGGRDGFINVINGATFHAVSVRVQNVGETGANRGAAKRRQIRALLAPRRPILHQGGRGGWDCYSSEYATGISSGPGGRSGDGNKSDRS